MRFIYGEPIGWLKSIVGAYYAEKIFNWLESFVIDLHFKGFKVPDKIHMNNETLHPILDDVVARLSDK